MSQFDDFKESSDLQDRFKWVIKYSSHCPYWLGKGSRYVHLVVGVSKSECEGNDIFSSFLGSAGYRNIPLFTSIKSP